MVGVIANSRSSRMGTCCFIMPIHSILKVRVVKSEGLRSTDSQDAKRRKERKKGKGPGRDSNAGPLADMLGLEP